MLDVFEPQQQNLAGVESEMHPPPQDEDDNYCGSKKLSGKTAIITGADSGIGKAVAIAFAKETATKAAGVGFTRALAKALAKKEIRVNAAAPGPVWTPLIPASFDQEKIKKFGSDTLLGRAGQPYELAPAYVF